MNRGRRTSLRGQRPRWIGYAVTLLMEAGLTTLLLFLMPIFPIGHYPIPYILLTLTIAYLFSEGPAVLSIFLGWFLFTYFFVPPTGIGWPLAHSAQGWAQQAALVLGVIVVGAAMTRARRYGRRIQQLNRDLEQRNAELDGERARWQGVVEGIADEVWVCDSQGRMSLINLATVTAMGLEAFKNKLVDEVLEEVEILYADGQPRPPEQAPLLRSLTGEIVRGEEIMRHRRTGTTRYRQFSSAPVRDASGAITGAVAVVRDVTDNKQTEEALRQSEQRLRAAFDNAALGIVEVDTQDHLIAVNDRACQILGYSREELLAMNVHELTYPEDRDTSDDMNARLHQGQFNMFDYEKRYLKRDGSPLWVHVTVSAIRDPDGRHLRSIGTFEDVGERRAAQEALRESEEDLNRAQAVAQTGSWRLDIRRNQLLWSEETYRIFGIPKGTPMTYEMFLGAIHPDDREYVEHRWNAALRGELYDTEHRILVDGRIKWVRERAELEFDQSGQLLGGFGTAQDITERKQAEEDIRKLNAELEQRVVQRTSELQDAMGELEAFSYSVSHDLRAPLRAIDGFSGTLLKRYSDSLDSEGQDYLCRVRTAAQRMSQLIDDILGLSRAGRAEMHRQRVDMSAMASEVLRGLQESQPDRRVEVMVATDLVASADPNLLRIVLDNLLGNAWKFTGKREVARIEVGSLEQDSGRIYFVRDNGAGFNPERADKLFVPFQRLHTESEFAGTGIGLALVQRIIRRHGGRIWAESEVGKGATFFFTLGETER